MASIALDCRTSPIGPTAIPFHGKHGKYLNIRAVDAAYCSTYIAIAEDARVGCTRSPLDLTRLTVAWMMQCVARHVCHQTWQCECAPARKRVRALPTSRLPDQDDCRTCIVTSYATHSSHLTIASSPATHAQTISPSRPRYHIPRHPNNTQLATIQL